MYFGLGFVIDYGAPVCINASSVCICVEEKEILSGGDRAKADFVNSASSAEGLGVFPLPRTNGVRTLFWRTGRGGR